jgi:hypothetical protein
MDIWQSGAEQFPAALVYESADGEEADELDLSAMWGQ